MLEVVSTKVLPQVMAILFALEAMLGSTTPGQDTGSYTNGADLKAQVREFGCELAPYYVEIGAAEKAPVTDHVVFASLPPYALAATWFTHGSHSCEARSVALAVYWQYDTFPFYGTGLWRGIMAHEWGHVTQGPACDNPQSELEADLAGYAALLESGNEQALAESMRRDLIILALVLAMDEGQPRASVLDQLQLSDDERYYYTHMPTKYLYHQAATYTRPLMDALLDDDDGIYTLHASPPRELDASGLWEWTRERLLIGTTITRP